MLKSVPVSCAALRSTPKTHVGVLLCAVSFIGFFMLVLRLVNLCMVSGLFGIVRRICGHVRRPPMGGSASVNMMSGGAVPSTTALATVSAVSLNSMSV